MAAGSQRAFVRTELSRQPAAAAPSPGAAGLVRANLFDGIVRRRAHARSLALIAWITPGLVRWLFIDAVWSAPDGEACRAPGAGACWAYIRAQTVVLHLRRLSAGHGVAGRCDASARRGAGRVAAVARRAAQGAGHDPVLRRLSNPRARPAPWHGSGAQADGRQPRHVHGLDRSRGLRARGAADHHDGPVGRRCSSACSSRRWASSSRCRSASCWRSAGNRGRR